LGPSKKQNTSNKITNGGKFILEELAIEKNNATMC
jgi:hypothetical protein